VIPEYELDADPSGRIGSYQPLGPTATKTNAFFRSLGTNGRACVTCHLPPSAMSVSVDNIDARWSATDGHDPIFAPIDGANCPNEVSGNANPRDAHSLLLNRGLFRIFLSIPDGAEFTVKVVNDPTNSSPDPNHPNGCNTDPQYAQGIDPSTGKPTTILSMYRRPRMVGNLSFATITRSDLGVNPPVPNDPITGQPILVGGVSIDPRTGRPISGNIMWDGREPTLESQASDATQGHAQAPNAPTDTQIAEMVQFELGIYNAQVWDAQARLLAAEGGLGGPIFLSAEVPGLPPQAPGATFSLFDAWGEGELAPGSESAAQRSSLARGQTIFQTRSFQINGVSGFNNIAAIGNPSGGTCSTCHNQVGTGNDSFAAAQLDIGIGGMTPAPSAVHPAGAPTSVPAPSTELPIFQFTCQGGASTAFEGPVVVANDPGLALISGKCADIGRLTVPDLRGLAARAPYFSDGSAATLLDVVTFYNNRFTIGLSNQDKADLIAFLKSL